jgi:peptidoglycan/xylan/chitin deacetylase (PgdA/CDA1 family)
MTYHAMFDLTLSFDNGPEPDVTPRVLDILARRNIKTTFFVIGEKLARPECRKLAERAKAEGHWIANHSYTHSVPLGLRDDEPDTAEREIGRTEQVIGNLAQPVKLFRPFGGGGNLDKRLMKASVADYLMRHRYTCVLWNAIPRDWDNPDGWVETAMAQCHAQWDTLNNWPLMVLHDLPTGAMKNLEKFLDWVGEAAGEIRQEFPPSTLPIVEGIAVLPLDAYVTGAPPAKVAVNQATFQ